MPGSSSTPATAAAAINSMVSKVLGEFAEKLEASTDSKATALQIIKESYKKHSRIVFNGNGYSKEWQEEAKKRGLTNLTTSNNALKAFVDPNMQEMFEETGLVTKEEAHARYVAYLERYVTQLSIESKVLIDIANRRILPAAIKYSNILSKNIIKNERFGREFIVEQEEVLKTLLFNINLIRKESKSLEQSLKSVRDEADLVKQADLAAEKLVLGLKALRKPCDIIESISDYDNWTLPTYEDLLFKL